MIASTKPFEALTAADLMSQAVVAIPQEMSLQAAARLLLQSRVSGAPVVDDQGRCVGVLSTTDFVHWAQKGESTHAPASPVCYCSDWQVPDVESLPADRVAAYMTLNPVTAAPTTGIGELARLMSEAHIHRVIVTDAERRPVGVVSSTDLLAAIARAVSGGGALPGGREGEGEESAAGSTGFRLRTPFQAVTV